MVAAVRASSCHSCCCCLLLATLCLPLLRLLESSGACSCSTAPPPPIARLTIACRQPRLCAARLAHQDGQLGVCLFEVGVTAHHKVPAWVWWCGAVRGAGGARWQVGGVRGCAAAAALHATLPAGWWRRCSPHALAGRRRLTQVYPAGRSGRQRQQQQPAALVQQQEQHSAAHLSSCITLLSELFHAMAPADYNAGPRPGVC